ncbi:MAG: FG-GAP repeat protein, partial [Verrucomicrobiota bacterium]
GAPYNRFGNSVSLHENIGIVGSVGSDFSGDDSGVAYLFRDLGFEPGIITETALLTASDNSRLDAFGFSVGVSGNTGLVSAVFDDDNGDNSGSAYLFRGLESASGTITETAKLVASDGESHDGFGQSLSIDGNTAVVGVSRPEGGSTYLFRNLDIASGVVSETAKLRPANTVGVLNFGNSVAVSDGVGMVGARSNVYFYSNIESASGVIVETVMINASDNGAGFGIAVSLDNDRFLVGASVAEGFEFMSGKAYTGTVSSITTLDEGNASRIIDGISFESRTDWIVGEKTDGNMVELMAGDVAEVLAAGAAVYIGKMAGSDNNMLLINGSLTANEAKVGSGDGNNGNTLAFGTAATIDMDRITLALDNSLAFEGELTSFEDLEGLLGETDLFVWLDTNEQQVTAGTFGQLLLPHFNAGTGFMSFTAIPEPGVVGMIFAAVILGLAQRRRGAE